MAARPSTHAAWRRSELRSGSHSSQAFALALALLCSGGAGCDYRVELGDEPADGADATLRASARTPAGDGSSAATGGPEIPRGGAASGTPPALAADPKPATDASQPAVKPAPKDPASSAASAAAGDGCGVMQSRVPCGTDPDPCSIHSGFEGDEYCLLPPAPGEGVQIHLGPESYLDPGEVTKYLVEPGDELVRSLLGELGIDEPAARDRVQVQARPGMHHWIARVGESGPEAGVHRGAGCDDAAVAETLAAGGNLVFDSMPGGKAAPENEGLGYLIDPGSLCLSEHIYNFEDTPRLNEVWINLRFLDPAQETQSGTPLALGGAPRAAVAPGQSTAQTYTALASGPGRILDLFGEFRLHTPRVEVWLNDVLVYEASQGLDPADVTYDSITLNPALGSGTSGAPSGIQEFATGDELKFTCFIKNNTDSPLTFGPDWFADDACQLWGHTVGASFDKSR